MYQYETFLWHPHDLASEAVDSHLENVIEDYVDLSENVSPDSHHVDHLDYHHEIETVHLLSSNLSIVIYQSS